MLRSGLERVLPSILHSNGVLTPRTLFKKKADEPVKASTSNEGLGIKTESGGRGKEKQLLFEWCGGGGARLEASEGAVPPPPAESPI